MRRSVLLLLLLRKRLPGSPWWLNLLQNWKQQKLLVVQVQQCFHLGRAAVAAVAAARRPPVAVLWELD